MCNIQWNTEENNEEEIVPLPLLVVVVHHTAEHDIWIMEK
jgi:hypothetical protein